MSADHPGLLVGTRRECPLVVGMGEGEHFLASAIPAFLHHTRRAHVMGEGEIAVLDADRSQASWTPSGRDVPVVPMNVDWDDDVVEKGGFETFMLKEIHEQGSAVADTLADLAQIRDVALPDIGISRRSAAQDPQGGDRRLRHLLSRRARRSNRARALGADPVEVDLASEFRHRAPLLEDDSLVIGVTQSGETADTLAAMRVARARGATVLALTNVPGSQATRDADGVL